MAWALWLWLWLALRARGCLHCDPGAARLLEELRGPFLLRQVPRDAELRARVAAVLQRGVLGLAEPPRGPAALIDEKTLHEAAAAFRRVMTRIRDNEFRGARLPRRAARPLCPWPGRRAGISGALWRPLRAFAVASLLRAKPRPVLSPVTFSPKRSGEAVSGLTPLRKPPPFLSPPGCGFERDEQLFNEVMWGLQEVRETFQKIINRFQTLVYCLNKCGQLLQLLTDCKTCKTDIHTCSKDVHCGDRKLEVEEDEDLILDCALTWHHVSYGIKNYIFYRVWGHTEQHIVSGPDPFLVRKEVTVNDSGSYRCEMRDAKNMLCSQMQFQVTVTPLGNNSVLPTVAPLWGPLTVPPTPWVPGALAHWTVWIVISSSTGLILLLLAGCFCFYHCQERAVKDDDDVESRLLRA